MLRKGTQRIHDERIENESNSTKAKMFYVATILLLLCMAAKILCQLPVEVYVLELGCLVISFSYVVFQKSKSGILFLREKDDVLRAITNRILANAYMIDFWIVVIGELVFCIVLDEYFMWVIGYMIAIFVPAIVITISSIMKGWLLWGSKKQEKKGIKELRKRVVIGSLFFGLFVGYPELYRDGVFQPQGILWVLGLGGSWGILFYLVMVKLMKVSEQNGDRLALEAENEVDQIEE